jgi:HSP20 family protein
MSIWGIEPYDWFSRFMRNPSRGSWPEKEFLGEFDDIRKEIERIFEEQFQEIQSTAPKELVREYETPEGGRVKEIGPLVYGYSVTIGPEGKPNVKEFGNIRPSGRGTGNVRPFSSRSRKAEIAAEREPLADIVTSDKEFKVVVELPGIAKEDLKINAYEGSAEIIAGKGARKYKRVVELPPDADIETARSAFNNGLLEITFDKKKKPERKGKEIKID